MLEGAGTVAAGGFPAAGATARGFELATTLGVAAPELLNELAPELVSELAMEGAAVLCRTGAVAGGIKAVLPYYDIPTQSSLPSLINLDSTITTTAKAAAFFNKVLAALKTQLSAQS